MATHHISANIEGLLNNNTNFLGRLFSMNGYEARLKLLALKEKGDKYIPSEDCKHFNPMKGCLCAEMEENNAGVIRSESKQIS